MSSELILANSCAGGSGDYMSLWGVKIVDRSQQMTTGVGWRGVNINAILAAKERLRERD
jgi:hypothetical protein